MASITLVHVISPRKVSGARLLDVLHDIDAHHRLVTGQGQNGHGVYAWYPGTIPVDKHADPMVVFEIDAARVSPGGLLHNQFAFIPAPIHVAYVSIILLGFVNAPPGFRQYQGSPVL